MKIVQYIESSVSDDQVRWGNNDDPRGLLLNGFVYHVLEEEVHSFHTKFILKEIPSLKFNSVHFKELGEVVE